MLPPSSASEAGPTPPPLDTETRWWLQIAVGEFDIRALDDSGACTTEMCAVGVQIASSLGRKFEVARSGEVRLTDSQKSALLGHVLLPFTVAGSHFLRSFKALLDPDTDRLYYKEAKAYVGLEVASLDTKGMALVAIGLADADSTH